MRDAAQALILLGLFLLALPGASLPLYGPEMQNSPSALEVGINPNIDPWWKLASLPKIGETRARQIIAARHTDGTPAFTQATDLAQIRGIGPATVQALAPYLVFEANARKWRVESRE